MCGKLEVVVSVSARRRNDVDWIVNELWMKRLFVEVRLKGFAEQDDDDEMDASYVWEGCEKLKQPFCQEVLILIWTNEMCGVVWNGVCGEVWKGMLDGSVVQQGVDWPSWSPGPEELWKEWVVSKSWNHRTYCG